MDPNATLAKIRQLYLKRYPTEDEMVQLAIEIQNLDEWLRSGGYLPAIWARTPRKEVS